MIVRQNEVVLDIFSNKDCLNMFGRDDLYKQAIFFDLEHYVYKKPICVGVFGCCYYDVKANKIKVTQYMIENKKDIRKILTKARLYFQKLYKQGKRYIVTFSGNNDFLVINHLFNKYNVNFDIEEHFKSIDLQLQYEKKFKTSIGLKNLEKKFNIMRDSKELISGQNLAKTFSKIIKDEDYINRMPKEKKHKILIYNEQDVVNLFHIYINWKKDKVKNNS